MGAVRAKVLDYELELDQDGHVSVPGNTPHALPSDLTAEHLLLAGLCRCALASLRYQARRAGTAVACAAARATGRVTLRESDGRYAFVDVAATLEVELDPLPIGQALETLLQKAERGCFISASLTSPPRYSWRVNGEPVR
jgi:organic hydroperoxide reductase OsmC/OhrA